MVSNFTEAGWSHFAQFTIAVVNKDPKKSKYSGSLCLSRYSVVVGRFTSCFHIKCLHGILICRYITSVLEKGARLGMEKIYGAVKSFGWVYRC